VTCSSDLFIKIWDSAYDWKNTKTFPGHEHSVSSVKFMPGDQHIVSASRDRTIRVFDIASTCVPLPAVLVTHCLYIQSAI
jgi:platelet-activating factor acetylhydrolase IB subunit alpha